MNRSSGIAVDVTGCVTVSSRSIADGEASAGLGGAALGFGGDTAFAGSGFLIPICWVVLERGLLATYSVLNFGTYAITSSNSSDPLLSYFQGSSPASYLPPWEPPH